MTDDHNSDVLLPNAVIDANIARSINAIIMVTVLLNTHSGKARVAVADNGPGIQPDEQERIFGKFHQLKGLRDEKPKGSGLGLTICHRIINYHGGNIWVESTPESGANFIFELSLVESNESPG